MIRLIVLFIFSVVLSAAILYTVTGNMMDMSEMEVNGRWHLMVLEGAPAANVAQDVWGSSPPFWGRKLAVIWARIHPQRWWWLPLVVMGAIILITRFSRKRTQRW